MKILITSGILPPAVGGPAQYAVNLKSALEGMGHEVELIGYTAVERFLPFGLRHVFFFLRSLVYSAHADCVLALDVLSTGIGSVFAAKMLRKSAVVRIGGDGLWERYVERTKEAITLQEFYATLPPLTFKERLMHLFTKWVVRSSTPAFTTAWQCQLFEQAYNLPSAHTRIVENFYPPKESPQVPTKKNFIFAGRDIFLKNKETLERAFSEAQKRAPDIILDTTVSTQREFFERLRSCYALVVPSLSDVSPNVVLEALRYNKPVIMTKESGLAYELRDTVYLVPPRDTLALRDAIVAFADPHIYDAYVLRASHFSKVRDWETLAREYSNIVNDDRL